MLNPGDLVGPYEIRGFIGQGGMGQVYKAFDPRLERTVALKVIVVPERASDGDSARVSGEFSARLLREARAVASLSHPNVVGVYDVGESNGRLYLAMEYVLGSTLRSVAADAPVARKLRWLVDVARALEVAHRAGLVHRDVKPENVMLREDGVVKVLDFGIARRTVAAAGEDARMQDTVTGSGGIAGTPVYMAPEQIKGHDVDARCDQFAWGVMAFELLAGERPWSDAGDVLSVVARILTDPVPPLRERSPDVPTAVEETIRRTLAKAPDDRFASMADVADAIEPFATQSTGGDRIRITPRATTSGAGDEPVAYAATTRVPTSVSLPPPSAATGTTTKSSKKEGGATSDAARKKRRARQARRRLAKLALPLSLLAALALAVFLVKTKLGGGGAGGGLASSAARPLSTVPEAEAAYVDAMARWRDGAVSRSRASLRRAIDLDPTFAAAHLELAIHLAQDDPSAAQAAYQSAYEHRHMLPVRESDLLEACEPYVRPRPDLEEWETRLAAAVFRHPRDAELQLLLGRARERLGGDDAAKQAYEDALKVDPGYAPALAALAGAYRNLGQTADALAATERCAKVAPVASICLETRYRLFQEIGECPRAREVAELWRQREPQSTAAHAAFARALYGDGAARAGVEEALSHVWSLQPAARRASGEQLDRMYLAIVDGELARADEIARDLEAALPATADQYDHAQPTRVRVNVLLEMGDYEAAAKVARAYLDKMDAWSPYLFAPDPSIAFYEPLYRAGQITKAELDAQRERWIAREKRRLAGGDHGARAAWGSWTLWGSFAETRDEAIEALEHIPAGVPLPVGSRRALYLDFALGKVYVLAGRPADAFEHLTRVTGTCASIEDAMVIARARYYLGMAYEAKGDRARAREAYARVAATWPKGTKSRTVRAAEQRLAALGR